FYKERHETLFIGVVQKMPKEGYIGSWVVDGSEIHVSSKTDILGKPIVGSFVEMEGRWQRESFSAYSVHLKEGTDASSNGEINGIVEGLPRTGDYGMWRVSGRKVYVTEATKINKETGKAAVGSEVTAKGHRIDGIFTASELNFK
ncbi:MAG: hypothetical protein D3924_19855, partial [Candidatus Electrothrix sp. AR4]|nr:hypothetical protein [Candidatus Electrothrix sp. AR4]